MHKFAFGSLGWKPYEYYTSSPYEFFAASEGYFDKMDNGANNLRVASYRIHQSLVKEPVKIEEFWPLWGDKKVKPDDKLIMTPELYQKIKKIYNLK